MPHMPAFVPPVETVPYTNAEAFGVSGNGDVDDTAALQAAIDATAGRVLVLPRGRYKITSTLVISDRMHRIVGEMAGRAAVGGTELVYYGTGPCIQIGTEDAGVDWDDGHYGGADSEQDQVLENLWISHGDPDAALEMSPIDGTGTGPHYKAGAYGIWDWYGGGLVLQNVGIEKFEANLVLIQSDINFLSFITSLYSKFGIYVGPRSDQLSLNALYSFYCDRAVTIDRASGARIVDPQIVGCGTSTTGAIEIRKGSTQTSIVRPWFEHLQGYSGTDQLAFVSAGEVDGYGPGGAIDSPGPSPTTTPARGVSIDHPFCYTTAAGIAYHARHVASVGLCSRFVLHHPVAQVGASLSNFDSLVGVQAASSPSGSETQVSITGVSSDATAASYFTNLGGGSPAWRIETDGGSGTKWYGQGVFSVAQSTSLGESVASTHAISGGVTITNGSGGNTSIVRNDGGSHAARPALTISNTGTDAFNHRAALLLAGRDSGGTTRTASVQGEAGLISITSDNNQDITLNAGTGSVRATSPLVAGSGLRLTSATGPLVSTGTGSPEGVLAAPVGSLYTRTDGGAATTLYVKESGTSDTGWVAK